MVNTSFALLPARNACLGCEYFFQPESKHDDEPPLTVYRELRNGVEFYCFERVTKAYPLDVRRLYVNPAKGWLPVKYELLHDFDEGRQLLRSVDVELQNTSDGVWYLKSCVERENRRDGSLDTQKKFEITNCDFITPINDDVFTWEGMSLPSGTIIVDTRLGNVSYTYGVPAVDEQNIGEVILGSPLIEGVVEAEEMKSASGQTGARNAGPPPTLRNEKRESDVWTWIGVTVGLALAGTGVGLIARKRTGRTARGKP
jgi:hypothetical protein